MLKASASRVSSKVIENLICNRIEDIEMSLIEDPTSAFNKFSNSVNETFHEILVSLCEKNNRHLIFEYESAHNGMWLELVHAAYQQGAEDCLNLLGSSNK